MNKTYTASSHSMWNGKFDKAERRQDDRAFYSPMRRYPVTSPASSAMIPLFSSEHADSPTMRTMRHRAYELKATWSYHDVLTSAFSMFSATVRRLSSAILALLNASSGASSTANEYDMVHFRISHGWLTGCWHVQPCRSREICISYRTDPAVINVQSLDVVSSKSLVQVLESNTRGMAADAARGHARAGRASNPPLLEPGIEVCNYIFDLPHPKADTDMKR